MARTIPQLAGWRQVGPVEVDDKLEAEEEQT
jgi:hypothetical protein